MANSILPIPEHRPPSHHALRLRTTLPRWWHPWLAGLTACLLLSPAHAIEDIPAGELLWLQGFDGNPATPGFRVDGTLLLRSVDDIANIGINLSSGAITNSPTGTISVEVGVTGARFINGPVINEGLFKASSGMTFGAPGSFIENRGEFQLLGNARVQVTGKGIRFIQQDGELDLTGGTLELYDGSLQFQGGSITGEPWLIRSQAEFPAGGATPFTPRFYGPGCTYRGPLGTNVSLKVFGTAAFGPSTSLTLDTPAALHGRIEVDRFGGGSVRLSPVAGRLVVASGGTLDVKPTGGTTTLAGELANDGTIHVGGELSVENPGTVATNRASLVISATGSVQFAGGLRLEAGAVELGGGSLGANQGLVLASPQGSLRGQLQGAVTNESRLTLEQTKGELAITGSFAAGEASELALALGDSSLTNPLLRTTQAFRAGGSIAVSFEAGFEPLNGDEFLLLQAAPLTGEFTAFPLPPLPAGLFWHLNRTVSRLRLTIRDTPPPPELRVDVGGSQPRVELTGTPGRAATIYQSTDLLTWTVLVQAEPFNGSVSASAAFPPADQPVFHRGEIEP